MLDSAPLIAIVEDEDALREDLLEFLQLRGFAAQGFADAETLIQNGSKTNYDLVIMDIGLPGLDGLQATQWLQQHTQAGIVILTAQGGQSDQVTGLNSGADAYLVKDASLEVIEATCHSVLRRIRSYRPSDSRPAQSLWRLSPTTWILSAADGSEIQLTHSETVFLQYLLQQPGIPVSRETLLAAQGKTDSLSNLRNLDNCASRLRRKVKKKTGETLPVQPSYGSGYTFTGQGEIESV